MFKKWCEAHNDERSSLAIYLRGQEFIQNKYIFFPTSRIGKMKGIQIHRDL